MTFMLPDDTRPERARQASIATLERFLQDSSYYTSSF